MSRILRVTESGLLSVRACWDVDGFIHSIPLGDVSPDQRPKFWGVYRNLADGTQDHLGDFASAADAQSAVDYAVTSATSDDEACTMIERGAM